jgi:hypothetical protein
MGNNVLYVEDNPDNMTLVQRALEARGYRLLKAVNGLSGVEIAEREDVDLILLDINLPDIDGGGRTAIAQECKVIIALYPYYCHHGKCAKRRRGKGVGRGLRCVYVQADQYSRAVGAGRSIRPDAIGMIMIHSNTESES